MGGTSRIRFVCPEIAPAGSETQPMPDLPVNLICIWMVTQTSVLFDLMASTMMELLVFVEIEKVAVMGIANIRHLVLSELMTKF